MKATVMSVLLCLLSALVEVHSQTVPYVSFMGTNLPNHSYVDLTLVGIDVNGSDSVQCHTDLSTCCSAAQGADRGDWYFPNGMRLNFNEKGNDIYEHREAQRVNLRRRNNRDISGIYRCTVETSAVHNDSGQEIVYAGLYASGGECTHMCMCTAKTKFVGLTVMFVMSGLLCQGLAYIHHKHLLSCENSMLLTTYRKRLPMFQATTTQ